MQIFTSCVQYNNLFTLEIDPISCAHELITFDPRYGSCVCKMIIFHTWWCCLSSDRWPEYVLKWSNDKITSWILSIILQVDNCLFLNQSLMFFVVFFLLPEAPGSRSQSNQHGCLKESLSETLQHPPARRYGAVSHSTEGTQRGMKVVLVPVNSSWQLEMLNPAGGLSLAHSLSA